MTSAPPSPLRPGHSLVELLVSLTILSLVVATLVGAVVTSLAQYGDQRAFVRAQESTRFAQEVIGRAFRTARADPTSASVGAIYPDPNNNSKFDDVRLVADFNPADGDVADDQEDMQFSVSADTLFVRWKAGGSNQALAFPVDSLKFEYYDTDGAAITAAADVNDNARRVRITLKAASDRYSTTLETVQTWIYLRNCPECP